MKGPWASQRDIQSFHIPATLTQESSAGAENSSPDSSREQVEKTSAGPGWSHRGALGVGEATCAVKPPLPAGASLQPLTVLRASPGFSFLIYEIWILVVKPFSHGCHANPMRQHLMKRASSNEVLMRESSGNRNRISDWGLEIIKSPSLPSFFSFFLNSYERGDSGR